MTLLVTLFQIAVALAAFWLFTWIVIWVFRAIATFMRGDNRG